jgi:hypothetical protein
MSITHATATRNAIAATVTGRVDLGTVSPTGSIQIATNNAFTTILATLKCANPAFQAPAGGQAVANAIAEDTNAAGTGTATAYRILDRDGNEVWRGTVSGPGGGGDAQLSNTLINAGDRVSCSALVYIPAT